MSGLEDYRIILDVLTAGIALVTLIVIVGGIYVWHDRATMRREIMEEAKRIVEKDAREVINKAKSELARSNQKFKEEIELSLEQAKTGVAITEKEAKKAKEITEEMKELKSAMVEPTPPSGVETNKEAQALLERGNEFRKKEDFDTAIYNYTKAIDKNPGYARAFSSRGNAYEQKKDHGSAIRDYTKAIELDPTNVVAVVSIGVIYSIKGDKKKARQWWEKAIEKKKYLTDDGKEMVRRWIKELEE